MTPTIHWETDCRYATVLLYNFTTIPENILLAFIKSVPIAHMVLHACNTIA